MTKWLLALAAVLVSFSVSADEARIGFVYEEYEGDFAGAGHRAGLLVKEINGPAYFDPPVQAGDLVIAVYGEGETGAETLDPKKLVRRLEQADPDHALSLRVMPKSPFKGAGHAPHEAKRDVHPRILAARTEAAEKLKQEQEAERKRERLRNWPQGAPDEETVMRLVNADLAARQGIYDAFGTIFTGQARTASTYFNMRVTGATLSACRYALEGELVECLMTAELQTDARDPITLGLVQAARLPTRRIFSRTPTGWKVLPP
jgi:hypothetical protein